MRTQTFALLLGVGLLLWQGCSSPATARQIAEGYLSALSELNFEGAAQYVAEEGKESFRALRRLYSGLNPAERKKFLVVDWVIVKESLTGDTATIDFTFEGKKKGQLLLRRVNQQWKVDPRQTL